MQTVYLLPLTVASLILAVAALGFRAKRRRGYGPLAVGVAGGTVLILGKFVLDSNIAVYGGLVGLIVASLWNSWPRSVPVAPAGLLYQIGSITKGDVKMATKRKIEVFSAGCPACQETVNLIQQIACPSCDVSILDMNDPNVAQRAKSLGIRSVPAVVINGKLADCCQGRGPDEATLRAAGLGVA
jgi:hypothetical protein